MKLVRAMVVLLVFALVIPATSAQTLPPEKLAAIKKATVFILVDNGAEAGSGSGFLVKVEGTTGYIATNHHVVGLAHGPLRRGISRDTSISIVFDSGLNTERIVKGEVVAEDPEHDLAMVKVRGVKELPKPLDVMDSPRLIETMPVLICGFPFGESLATGKKKPNLTIGKATISSVRNDDLGNVSVVQLDGALNPGNSGGPILTTDGKLAGIAVATIRGSGIGLAIPYRLLHELFDGTVGSTAVFAAPLDPQSLEIKFEVPTIDPFSKLKAISLQYRVTDAKEVRTNSMLLETLPLVLKNGWATGKLNRPRDGKTKLSIQVAFVRDGGKTFTSPPASFTIPQFDAKATAKDGRYLSANTGATDTATSGSKALPTLKAFEQSPEKFLGSRVTIEVLLGSNLQIKQGAAELEVYSGATTRARKLDFRTALALGEQVRELGEKKSARLTGTMYAPESARANYVFEVEEIGILGDDGSVARSLKHDVPPIAVTGEPTPKAAVVAPDTGTANIAHVPAKGSKIPTLLIVGAAVVALLLIAALVVGIRLMKYLPGRERAVERTDEIDEVQQEEAPNDRHTRR